MRELNVKSMQQKISDLENPKKSKSKDGIWLKIENDIKYQLRILIPEDGDPWREFHVHYNVGKNFGFLCPKANFDEPCAVCDFAWSLWNDRKDHPENEKIAKQLLPTKRFITPVMVLQEDGSWEGPKVWNYGNNIYQYFMRKYTDPDWTDFWRYDSGRNIKVLCYKEGDKYYPTTDVDLAPKESKLGTSKQIEAWEKEIPNLDELFNRKTSAEVKLILEEYLAGEDGAADEDKYGSNKSTSSASSRQESQESELSRVEQSIRELIGD